MATKIRLARHGKKRYAYYHIVVADARAKRDGKNIERIGDYNPNTNPATINLDFERALHWVQEGAQPTDTARAILSYKGVMYKNHLLKGIKKGAITEEEVESKFNAWIADQDSRVQAKRDDLKKKADSANAERTAAESKIKEARAAEILAKQTPLAPEGAEGAVATGAAVVAGAVVADAVADVVDGDASAAEAVEAATEKVEEAVEAAAEAAGVEVNAEEVAKEAVAEAAEDLADDAKEVAEAADEKATEAVAEAAEEVSEAAEEVADAAEEAKGEEEE